MKVNDIFCVFLSVLFILFVSVLFLFENKEYVATNAGVIYSQTVIIDPGHGGEDGGAESSSGLLEKQINLQISNKLEAVLNLCGINTDMTRREDISLSDGGKSSVKGWKFEDMHLRVKKVSDTHNATLISIHQNSFPESKYKGAQVFYTTNNTFNKELAKSIQFSLKNGLDQNNKRTEKESDKSIFLLRNVNCPAVLVECGFLSNDEEANLLRKDTYQTRIAVSIAAGFLNYQTEKRCEGL